MTDTWKFHTLPAQPRSPQVLLFVFATGSLGGDAVLSLERFGAPSEQALAQCTLRTIERAIDPRWFDAWRQGNLRAIAEADLGDHLAQLDAADHVHVIRSEPDAPGDLSYLQAAWAIARYLVDRGASIVLDAHAMRYLRADSLTAPEAALDVAHEVRVVYETDATRASGAHAIHTRGMRKFGAPDLIALCTDADARFIAHVMTELAEAVACGTDLATPKHAVHVAAGVTWVAVEDEHRLGEVLQLGNAARVLVDESGRDLIGILGRLPRAEKA
jgi:hypothetical protein